jgi:hypothetical protein
MRQISIPKFTTNTSKVSRKNKVLRQGSIVRWFIQTDGALAKKSWGINLPFREMAPRLLWLPMLATDRLIKWREPRAFPLLMPAAPVKGSLFLVGNGQDSDFIQTD